MYSSSLRVKFIRPAKEAATVLLNGSNRTFWVMFRGLITRKSRDVEEIAPYCFSRRENQPGLRPCGIVTRREVSLSTLETGIKMAC